MRIALTYNLQRSDAEAEAEFDRPETIEALSDALRALGHAVTPVEVTGSVSRVVATLEALSPDLVFNTAEGTAGRFREAFYPAVFDQLGLPYTGSDAWVCALTLDKRLTKLLVAQAGVRVPAGWVVTDPRDCVHVDLRFPAIVKPNFEGSSKGITQDSVVEDPEALSARVRELLTRFPSGVLIEEFVTGMDVTVPFLEAASPETGGVLEPAEYVIDEDLAGPRAHNIYDYHLKQDRPEAVSIRVPGDLSPGVREQLVEMSGKVVAACGIRDLGRVDFRVARDGTPYFIEVNALPSLEPGASIYASAALTGRPEVADVLDAVVRSAAERRGVRVRGQKRRGRQAPLRVGLAFNLKRQPVSEQDDGEAEFDAPSTVEAIRDALEDQGHRVVMMEAHEDFPEQLRRDRPDLVFNIAEGIRGRSREAQIPALLELMGVEYTGSDATTLSLCLDKHLARHIVAAAGVAIPRGLVMRSGKGTIAPGLRFPAVVKPAAEGSSKGVTSASLVHDVEGLRVQVDATVGRYGGSALVEEYLPGREFTVGLLGNARPSILPPMEIVFLGDNPFPVYSLAHKTEADPQIRYDVVDDLDPSLDRALRRTARTVFEALGCRDVARVDLRLDEHGAVHFIECNPLPGLAPGFSDLCVMGERSGMSYGELIRRILAPAVRRWRMGARA